jgi:UDP-glucuronate 4-epimerase
MTVLVTGVAGFIGFHVASALLRRGETVCGIDNVNDYYSVALKRARLAELANFRSFALHEIDIADRDAVAAALGRHDDITGVVHLAAQAGVRYSLINPYAYVQSNVMGQVVMLEAARRLDRLRSFVYASSSSVYGGNQKQPFSIEDRVDDPVSLYAATKRACELTTISYCHLFAIPATGLRYFTVYGPWGRPDMAMWIFASAILAGRPIKLFNHGNMRRDFTYIDDVVESVVRLVDCAPTSDPKWSSESPDPGSSAAPWRVYNIGNNNPVELLEVVRLLEEAIGMKAKRELLAMQPGDVPATFADVDDLMRDVDFKPATPIAKGVARFIDWYRSYHRLR